MVLLSRGSLIDLGVIPNPFFSLLLFSPSSSSLSTLFSVESGESPGDVLLPGRAERAAEEIPGAAP